MDNNILSITVVTGFLGLVTGIQRFILPIALVNYGWDLASYGTIYVIQAIGMSLPLILGGFSTDFNGRRITIILSFITFAIGSFYFAFVISGTNLILLIVAQVITTISGGISRMGLSIQMADETEEGEERTNSLGVQAGARNLMGFFGPLSMGILLDNVNFQFLFFTQYELGFIFLGILGLSGVFFAFILPPSDPKFIKANKETSVTDLSDEQKKMQFGFTIQEMIIGLTSGMIVPFITFYIISMFDPTNTQWGILNATGRVGIALGSIIGARYAEGVGKSKIIFSLYLLVPFMAAGIAFAPTFSLVGLFYVLRITTANLVHPIWQSWYFSHILANTRGRLMSVTQLSRRLLRAVGTSTGPLIFGTFGPIIFPIACTLYPVAMAIPGFLEQSIDSEKNVEIEKQNPTIAD